MNPLEKLKALYASTMKAANAILDASATGILTEDEQASFDKAHADALQIKSNIEKLEVAEATKISTAKAIESLSAPAAIAPATGEGSASHNPEEKKVFATLGEQLQAVAASANPNFTHPGLAAMQELQAAALGQNEKVDSEGGFLVQHDFSDSIRTKMFETGEILSRVEKIQVSGNGLKLKTIKENSRVDGSRHGGIQTYWADEAASFTSSKTKFDTLTLDLKKVLALSYVTEELLQDSTAMQSVLERSFQEAITFSVEDSIINGTGVGQPLGILTSDAAVVVAKEGSQTNDTVVFENVSKMRSRLFAANRKNAIWLINQDIEPELDNMSLSVGSGGGPVYLPASGGVSTGGADVLYRRPIVPVEYCQTLGDKGDIIFADLSKYIVIDKAAPKFSSSMHVRFDTDEQAFKISYRVDGQPEWKTPLTPKNGSNTYSPFVTLEAR